MSRDVAWFVWYFVGVAAGFFLGWNGHRYWLAKRKP